MESGSSPERRATMAWGERGDGEGSRAWSAGGWSRHGRRDARNAHTKSWSDAGVEAGNWRLGVGGRREGDVAMPVNVNEIVRKLRPAERKKVEARAAQLIAEEMSLRDLRKA